MESRNFEFLRAAQPELASLGGFVEQYAYPDPASAMVKLRTLVERMVLGIYHHLGLPKPYDAKLIDLLKQDAFVEATPPVILSKLHQIRMLGNQAAHEDKASSRLAAVMLKDAHDLARWFHLTFNKGKADDCPEFIEIPSVASTTTADLERERRILLRRMASQEAAMQDLLKRLEDAEAKAESVQKSESEKQTLREMAQHSISVLEFDEAATRKRFIDVALAAVGWDVDDRDSVGQEVEVLHQPTETGVGYADYVLWGDDGKPLAVIEAKKTAVSAERGREQARYYADGFEKMSGFRPVIFYTNGYDIFVWNDAQNEPPRKLFGFYSKDSLDYLIRTRERKTLETAALNPTIAGRDYQFRCIRETLERFGRNKRKALLVMATGTGKTRVAISICDALINTGWAKRILFLCDRKELRKQAKEAFTDHLPGQPLCIVKSRGEIDRTSRIYLATYPSMMRAYPHYDVGFFDLVIADESHRSIYNRYSDLFVYFDALQIGLTATPRKLISHNTYKLFNCEDDNPSSFYDFKDAINDTPPSLVPFEVHVVTTKFLREGIGYWRNLTDEQKRQTEEQLANPEQLDADAETIDKQIFNRDTGKVILKNLMEHGLRVGEENRLGKTIIFARSHRHAVFLQEIFDQEWPQYGGKYCRVIDNYDPRAQQLIDDFKGIGHNNDLTIAISVDMLDTGVDIPEVANLVFAKPVKSNVKFWQMIGRGTRLCKDLHGLGRDKKKFLIFDHWKNFEYFDEEKVEVENAPSKALTQLLFDARLEVAEAALAAQKPEVFGVMTALLRADINALPEKSISVKEKWREVQTVKRPDAVEGWQPATVALMKTDISKLMMWRDIRGDADAYEFDLLIARLQKEWLKGSSRFDDYKSTLIEQVSQLPVNLGQVMEKLELIDRLKTPAFWVGATFADLEQIRRELRGLMKYRVTLVIPPRQPLVIDVTEDEADIQRSRYQPKLEGLQLAAYQREVREVLDSLLESNETLRKIKAGSKVNDTDLTALVSLVLTQNPNVNLELLTEFYPKTAGHLDMAIRRIIGLDGEAVAKHFQRFLHSHSELTSKQMRFLEMLKNHIGMYGAIEISRLYESPFTTIDADSIDGVFPEAGQVDDLLEILAEFENPLYERGIEA